MTIHWGIIGVGDVCEVKSGPGFQKADGSALVAVMRRDGDKARDFAQRHGVPRWYDDAEALIHDDEVDAVYIATPPHVHKEYTLLAARAGKPVYCEKPMALNFAECGEMIAACESAGVPLWVAYYRRALPKFLKLKELLDGGAIGAAQAVRIELYQPPREVDPTNLPWRVRPKIGGGGIFVDMGVHMLDVLDYLLGPVVEAHGIAVNLGGDYPAEDNVSASLRFENGALGSGHWSFTSHENRDKTVIRGARGKITFATFNDDPIHLQTGDGVQTFDVTSPPHIAQPLIQTIVDELHGRGTCPSTGVSGARTNWVVDRVLAGYQASRGSNAA